MQCSTREVLRMGCRCKIVWPGGWWHEMCLFELRFLGAQKYAGQAGQLVLTGRHAAIHSKMSVGTSILSTEVISTCRTY